MGTTVTVTTTVHCTVLRLARRGRLAQDSDQVD